MNKRYASIGLVVAGLAAVAAFSFYFVQREWNLAVQISLALIVIGVAAFILLDPDRARNMVSGRQARYGSNAVVLSLAFTGIIIVLNVLVYQNATDWKLRWDWTENQDNTLAPETIDILATMPSKVTVRAYYTSSNAASMEQTRDLLDNIKFYAGDNFEYEIIDPGADPLGAQQDGITRDGTLIFELEDNIEQVTTVTEQEIATALIRLLNPGDQKVYFLIGHGERNFEETGDGSVNLFKLELEGRNYTVESLNLLATNAIPEDARLLIVAGPTIPYTPEEVALIKTYVDLGGALMVLYEPVPLTEFGVEPEPLTMYLQENWGIVMGNDLIVDLSANVYYVAVGAEYASHVIINDTIQSVATVFPTARSVSSVTDIEGITKTVLVSTSTQSWAETDFLSLENQQPAPEDGEDIFGPVPLAVVANNPINDAQLIVVGDSDFVINAYYAQYGNADLILNMVDWAAGQEDIISLTPKTTTQRTLQLPPQTYILNLLLFLIVLVVPGLMLFAGVFVWFQRRRRA